MAVSAAGDTAASGHSNGDIAFWDVSTGRRLASAAGRESVTTLALSADGRTMVCDSGPDLRVSRFEGEPSVQMLGEPLNPHLVDLRSRQGSGDPAANLALRLRRVDSVALSADGRAAIAGHQDGRIRVWDLASGHCRQTLDHAHPTDLDSEFVGDAFVSDIYRELASVFAASDAPLERPLIRPQHTPVALSRDGGHALSGSRNGTVRFWDVEAGKCLWETGPHPRMVQAVSLVDDPPQAMSAGLDGSIRKWDLATGACTNAVDIDIGWPFPLVFSTDGRTVVNSPEWRTVGIWDAACGRRLRTLAGHGEDVWSVAINGDCYVALSASADASIRRWALDWELEFDDELQRTPA